MALNGIEWTAEQFNHPIENEMDQKGNINGIVTCRMLYSTHTCAQMQAIGSK